MDLMKYIDRIIKNVAYILIILGGFTLILIGLLSLFLPILPGWLLIIAGVLLLGEKTKLSRYIIGKLPPRIKEKIVERQNKEL
ncbi:MAG: hypothetical protein UU65_C0002G0288 [candidate division CPR2 bacterium GW2011_GWC1_41_48]|uniref:Transmembrane protein (PGPGW) n=1 Tax=candidate division CPR2 bacterium GW2011_GWC1_41_48 TaxID=1618344 RepID=A0A0G0W951_UNCC2|nr:MAG: hypothetical protein UT47_C0002G0016 [candidate division CPR2 bacterium GW2011_GWC2_39_35]KKR27942.1 MAG: hypothetical protein UT59_C0039G0008 [candidate division CPR2 bacterium GW2011_GWD1_39_7]KKR29014.1 MAG: hypothetical protein UT60_C0008G0057 [candidate division CPR2 bacterium GW2011_GWD2_39_7]KKS09510.1 MAG: hypothetical protein UU65_C0002G0288 [candidate division CPR2 bacterium GW2011_GWC1_41_48]OGB60148.1 MAG: hypothetical protein A2Y27_01440 [candidate division CPR2 bacterium G